MSRSRILRNTWNEAAARYARAALVLPRARRVECNSAVRDDGPSNERWVSHATPWEVAIKLSLRKLRLNRPFAQMFPTTVLGNGWRFLPPDFAHYSTLITLPLIHRDPFDRLMIAQAQREGLTVVTCDPHFAPYGVPLLW